MAYHPLGSRHFARTRPAIPSAAEHPLSAVTAWMYSILTVALIVPRDPGPPEILATAALLSDLLDAIGAPPAESLS